MNQPLVSIYKRTLFLKAKVSDYLLQTLFSPFINLLACSVLMGYF